MGHCRKQTRLCVLPVIDVYNSSQFLLIGFEIYTIRVDQLKWLPGLVRDMCYR